MPAEWCRNAIYVAMSRAELASQLYVFTLSKHGLESLEAFCGTDQEREPDCDDDPGDYDDNIYE
jgi:hypothetical protein